MFLEVDCPNLGVILKWSWEVAGVAFTYSTILDLLQAVFKAMMLYDHQGKSEIEDHQNQSFGGGLGNTELREKKLSWK